MARLQWFAEGKKLYEGGTSNGVLYTSKSDGGYDAGVAWEGLISVKQSPDGAEVTAQYANNRQYIAMQSAENFKGSIEAFTYPDEFKACDGSKEVVKGVFAGQQNRSSFGMAYSTLVGNDTQGFDHGEKIHIIYGARVSPSSRDYTTINDNPEAITFSWEFTTTPQSVSDELATKGIKPTAYLEIDLTKLDGGKIKSLKDKLYGTEEDEPTLPTIDEIATLIGAE